MQSIITSVAREGLVDAQDISVSLNQGRLHPAVRALPR
jgi:hypothetical protein